MKFFEKLELVTILNGAKGLWLLNLKIKFELAFMQTYRKKSVIYCRHEKSIWWQSIKQKKKIAKAFGFYKNYSFGFATEKEFASIIKSSRSKVAKTFS